MTAVDVRDTPADIVAVCEEIKELLLAKNSQYGDSAFAPVRVFSKAPTDEQIKVRIDDKLSRLAHGHAALESDDEVLDDLIGYLLLLKIARRREPLLPPSIRRFTPEESHGV